MKPTTKWQARALADWRKLSRKQRDDLIDFIFDDARFHAEDSRDGSEMVTSSVVLVRLLEAIDRLPEMTADWYEDWLEEMARRDQKEVKK